jgi:hypothetical protein
VWLLLLINFFIKGVSFVFLFLSLDFVKLLAIISNLTLEFRYILGFLLLGAVLLNL